MYTEKRMVRQCTKRLCKRCYGAGEYPSMTVDGFQVKPTMVECRCLDGVIA